MSLTHEQFLAALVNLNKEQIRQAGQRYTPGIDPDAPNLRVESLFTAIENLACGTHAQARFQAVLDDLSHAWGRAKHCSQRPDGIQARINEAQALLAPMIVRLRACNARAGEEWAERVAGLEADLLADIAYWRAEEDRLSGPQEETPTSNGRDAAQRNINVIARCLAVVREEKEYTETSAFRLLWDPQLLISGEWGTGKTHLLCDVTQGRNDRGKASILVLAKNFEGSVVTEVCRQIDPNRTADQILDQLQDVGSRQNERAVVILEGVNEGRRREWRRAVSIMRALVADRPAIGLVVSCRTPFESYAISKEDLQCFHLVTHYGFDNQEFDAQTAFFAYYNLPLPEVPLLDREFSRPLTLKLICQSLQNLARNKKANRFAGIASGQKGMTYVIESFVNRIGSPIVNEFGLNPNGCWWLLKGSDRISDRRSAGLAPCMATTLRGYVRPSEADRIIAAHYPALGPSRRRKLLEALRVNGLIEEDCIYYTSKSGLKSRIVFRLPYQRFSDHLIARDLLRTHLDVSSPSSIRRSFSRTSPLGKIFRMASRHHREYAEPSWAQALITEFPTRVGGRLPAKDRELFFALPKRAQNLSAYFEPFVEGLFWRDPAAFTQGTRRVINQYLNAGRQTWEPVVDALAAIATKPKHPFHAQRLYAFLAKYSMAERDLKWSEYLRRKYASPTIHRLLTWADKLNTATMTEQSAKELVVLLSLVLTTVVRNDRDLATKALVLIGERFPEVLFAHVIASLEFDDPYLSERMLAAAYGVVLSLVDSDDATTFRRMLGVFAKALYGKMFATGAPYTTHHTLKRDYARGIIEVAQRAQCVTLPKTSTRNLNPPYPQTKSTFASNGTPNATVTDAIGYAIQMDFGNYTIGRLIPGRANYDEKNPEYVKVRAKIERRIFDLGYRKEWFDACDREISNASPYAHDGHKVDRYGKKYAWIAYFEMWGEREARKALPDWRVGERISDCGVDPSFPKRPPDWSPPMPDLFGNLDIDTEAWAESGFTPEWKHLLVVPEINGHQGDWVLVEGFVRGVNEVHDREIFAFLRGAFVARRDVRRLRTRFLVVDYPGNGKIPEGAEEHYLYAGEAGRRANYARHLYQRSGRYRRQVVEAFDRYVTIKAKGATPRPTIRIRLESSIDEETDEPLVELLGPPLRTRHVPGVRIELPSIQFSWESYHSTYNDFLGFDLPAPSLIQRLGLASKNREIDFYDASGRPGTLYREAGDGWKGNRHGLLYVRADLLRRYLKQTRQVLVWCNWGERDWLKKMEGHVLIENPARQRIYQAHGHIHRSFAQWCGK